MSAIRVLVVDDSFFMRQTITKMLTCPEIEVIDSGRNGKEAVEKARLLKPDVITMDIEMPLMTGIEALKIIMKENPIPVIMFSTLTEEGADSTLEALAEGAVDFITKRPAFKDTSDLKNEIIEKVKALAVNSDMKNKMIRNRLLRQQKNISKPTGVGIIVDRDGDTEIRVTGRGRPSHTSFSAVCIGTSTGGPAAMIKLLPFLPKNFPVPIVVVQHMPPLFTASLAKRLNLQCHLNVKEAEHNDLLMPGNVYYGQGGKQMLINKVGKIEISDKPSDSLFKPSVDVTLNSMIDVYGKRVLGVIMTGMGKDGGAAMNRLNLKGGYIIAQNIKSSIAPGMPRTVISLKIADEIHPLEKLAKNLSECLGTKIVNSL